MNAKGFESEAEAIEWTDWAWWWQEEHPLEPKHTNPFYNEYEKIVGHDPVSFCFLCEWDAIKRNHGWGICVHCPYFRKFGYCNMNDKPYASWCISQAIGNYDDAKKWATAFWEQIKALKERRG